MRKAMPDFIATANIGDIQTKVIYPSATAQAVVEPNTYASTTIDYAQTTPPIFLSAVPYSVELLAPGSGYTRGGYFVYGVDNMDLLEISFNIDCGEVVDVVLTKLALDSTIYEKLSQSEESSSDTNYISYKVNNCSTSKTIYNFNAMIPDIIELSKENDSHYTYCYDGYGPRSQTSWYGGSGACIRINKGYGFFSNLGHTEQTNYAYKNTNSRYGPGNDEKKNNILFISSVAESCKNNFGETRNSLNFSTFYQTEEAYQEILKIQHHLQMFGTRTTNSNIKLILK